MPYKITLLPGDGIGPEITRVARAVLEQTAAHHGFSLEFEEHVFGGAAIDACGKPLPEETLNACKRADAIFLGAVGGPAWDKAPERPEAGLLALRRELDVFANLRPVGLHPNLAQRSPLRPERIAGVDLLIVRELTGGIYFGKRQREHGWASDECRYDRKEIERVARIAFSRARARRGRLTSVDKANVLETSRLWRDTVTEMGQTHFPDVALDHMYVDAAAMHLLQNPASFDVVLTENMFGDILSDEASVLPGSIGLLGSASIGETGPGLFEPIHGSAPDIAGQDKANPVGAVESVAQLLEVGLGETAAAETIRTAIAHLHDRKDWTADLGGTLSCSAVGIRLLEYLPSTEASLAS